MKKISIVLFAISIILFSCEKPEDLTNQIDITEFNWKIKSLTINSKKTNPPELNYFGNEIDNIDAYVLRFVEDTLFRLDLSINQGEGEYYILTKGNININDYGLSKMCCDIEFDENLAIKLPTVTEYQILDNILIFRGENCEIKFEKQ